MPQLIQSSVACTSNNHVTIVPVTKSETFNDALLISFWCFFTNFNSKSNQIICSIHPCSFHFFSRIFGSANGKKLFDNITLTIDHETNQRLKLDVNNISSVIQSHKGLPIFSWNHITFVISCNPLTILFKLNHEYFEFKYNENIHMYDLDLSHYNLTISSSKPEHAGFNGLFGPLFYSPFKLQNKSTTGCKQKYLNILIQQNIEHNTKFILNINNNNYGHGVHHKLSIKQHSLLTLTQLLQHECNDIVNVSHEALMFCKWENMFISDVKKAYYSEKIKPLSPPIRNLILVCHDMAGGYHHDANAFGNHMYNNTSQLPFEYFVEYWPLIDIFVYFSHDFITIPPVQWIDICHKNNVLILGTLITEHEYGIKLNHQIIDNEYTRQNVVDKLVNLAVYYGFDGWFLNFESPLNDVTSVNNLILFVRELTRALHKEIVYGKVIWYDSISCKTGKVAWQSRLNAFGMPFFNECDGFFTDYHWRKQYAIESIQFASKSNREYAVFTGIDIWGRGTWGDGGYNTGNIVNYLFNEIGTGTSVGLFASAWTFEHECECKERGSLDDNYCNDYAVELFRMNEKYFWCGEKYFLYQCNVENEWNANKIGQNGWQIDKENECWIASFIWCKRQININLYSKFNMDLIKNKKCFKIMIKQSVIGNGPNFADLYEINIQFKDFNGNVIHKIESGQMVMNDEWKVLLYEYNALESNKITNIVITEKAKDVEYWAGNYGTKVKYPVVILTFDDENKNDVSIIDAIKIKNNKSFDGCDTFLYIDDENENKLFWCTTFCLGFGKKYMNPCLYDICVTDIHEISDHCWFDLSLADYNKSIIKLADNKQQNEFDEFNDSEDEEMQRAIKMSMMEEKEDKEEYNSNDNWRVLSYFDDAFVGGHCIQFQCKNIESNEKKNNNSVFIYPLHCIAQNKYVDSNSLITFSFAIKEENKKEYLFYLSINYIDSLNICHSINCILKEELNKNNILILCGHMAKQCYNGWILHRFDFKMNNQNKNEKIKLKSINANIFTNKSKCENNYNILLGYISICIEAIEKKKKKILMDEEKEKDKSIIINHIPTINSNNGGLDNMIRIDWSQCNCLFKNTNTNFKMINLYLINSNYKINQIVDNKWLNSINLLKILGDKAIQNIEWLLSTKFEKKQLFINHSRILSILQKWRDKDNKNRLSEQMLLFEVTDLKYYKQYSSMWCVIKLQSIIQ